MDGFLAVIIIIGVISAISSSIRKRADAQRRASGPVDRAANARKTPAADNLIRNFVNDLREQAALDDEDDFEGEPAPQKAVSAAPQPKPVSAAPIAPAQPSAEGSYSTQGEAAHEHDEHRRKILEDEARITAAYDAQRELYRLNLQKLRAAVVMSEVLDKPVSMR